jgi:hypothetical protein
MWASGQELEAEARKAAKDKADGVKRIQLSPKAIKDRAKRKKAAQRKAASGG